MLSVLLQFIVGCERNQNFDASTPSKNSFTVKQVQAWYGNENVRFVTLKSAGLNSQSMGMKPDWSNFVESQNDQIEVVEVGIYMQGGFTFLDNPSYQEWKTTKNNKMISSLTRMVFLKHKEDGRIEQFLMTVFGDKGYKSNKDSKLNQNTYLSRDKNFSGNIFYHDIEGTFVNGWKYKNGNVVAKTTLTTGSGLNLQLKTAEVMCTATTYTTLWEQCTDWYKLDQSSSEFWYTNTTCDYYETQYSAFDCQYYISTGSGGASGGYSIAATPLLSTSLARIFRNGTDLTGCDLETLNIEYQKLLQDCIGAKIDAVVKSSQIVNNKIFMDSGLPLGVGASYSSTGNLRFRTSGDINVDNMKHEWIHMYQYRICNNNVYDPCRTGMAEYEIALFLDIEEYVKLGGNISSSTHGWACYQTGSSSHAIEYTNWLSFLTSNGTNFPSSIDATQFRSWATIFGTMHYTDKDYSSTTYSPTSLNELLNFATSCLN